ncbi:hypothetical protein [Vibrio parahaemolyticus]
MNNTQIIEILKPLGYKESEIKNNKTFIVLINRMIEDILDMKQSYAAFDDEYHADVSALDLALNNVGIEANDDPDELEEMFGFEGLEIIRQVEHLTFNEINEVIGE